MGSKEIWPHLKLKKRPSLPTMHGNQNMNALLIWCGVQIQWKDRHEAKASQKKREAQGRVFSPQIFKY